MHDRKIGVTFVCNFALRRCDFRGWWSATPKNRGRSKKTQEQTALKSRRGAVVWQWEATFKEAVLPPPPPLRKAGAFFWQWVAHLKRQCPPPGTQVNSVYGRPTMADSHVIACSRGLNFVRIGRMYGAPTIVAFSQNVVLKICGIW